MERLSDPLPTPLETPRPGYWKWLVCGLLFLATMLMYMDRQTLAQSIDSIKAETGLNKEDYGQIDAGFSLGFAIGSLVLGLLADRVNVRWLYPLVLLGWSIMGVATASSEEVGRYLCALFGSTEPSLGTAKATYWGMLACRMCLGFFEAGHWPCALITTKRLLSSADRTLGNSVLQSGATIGAIATPLIIEFMRSDIIGSWRLPFVTIGYIGMLWIVPWLLMIRSSDLLYKGEPSKPIDPKSASVTSPTDSFESTLRQLVVVLIVVSSINATWQFFRTWTFLIVREKYPESKAFAAYFSMAFYFVADIGCLSAGAGSKLLSQNGQSVHRSRTIVFFLAAIIACIACLAASFFAASPVVGWSLLVCLLFVGFGTLGLFPTYYSLSQDVSAKFPGTVAGALGAAAWVVVAIMQYFVGKSVEASQSYSLALAVVGLVPLLGCGALLFLWPKKSPSDEG